MIPMDETTSTLYTGADYQRAADTIRRIGTCHDQRIAADVSDRPGRAVAAARLAVDLVETATTAELRAMVVQLTTPELRPAIPVVLGPTPEPAPPASWVVRVLSLVKLYGNACHELSGRHYDLAPNVRQLLDEIREALTGVGVAAVVSELEQAYRDSPGFRDGS